MRHATVLVAEGSTVLVAEGSEYQVWQRHSWRGDRRIASAPATAAGWAAITETMASLAPAARPVEPPHPFRRQRVSPRAWAAVGAAAVLVAGATAGTIYATSDRTTSGDRGGLAAITGWVYSDDQTVLLLTWNRRATHAQGSLQVAQDTGGTVQTTTSAAYTAVITDDQVDLTIPTGLGTVTSLSAVLTDHTLTLAVPDGTGTIEQAQMHPGTVGDYSTAVTALQTRLGQQASAAASSSAVASQSAAAAAAVDQTARALASEVDNVKHYTTSAGTDLAQVGDDLTRALSDLATTQRDAQTAVDEVSTAPPGQACADAGTAGADAGTVAADQGAVTADLAALANDITALNDAVAAVASARTAYAAAVQSSPSTTASTPPPATADLDAALAAAVTVTSQANAAASTAPTQVAGYVQQAQTAADDASRRAC